MTERSIVIHASGAVVYDLVADPMRMAEWSPQVTSTRLSAGTPELGVGTRFTNRNVHGELVWTTHAEITRYDRASTRAPIIDRRGFTPEERPDVVTTHQLFQQRPADTAAAAVQ